MTAPGPADDVVTRLDLEGYQGNGRALIIPLDRADGAPLELGGTGWSARAQVRRDPRSSSPVLHEWATQDGGRAEFVALGPREGEPAATVRWGIKLRTDDSDAWAWCGMLVGYTLVLKDPEGRHQPVAAGELYWHPSYTAAPT